METAPATTHVPTQPVGSAQDLIVLANRFAEAKALLVGVELGVFTFLRERPATEEEIREGLKLHDRAGPDFLHLLAALGLLESDGAVFRNRPIADRFLVDGSAEYLGNSLSYYSSLMYPAWHTMAEAITGADLRDDARADTFTSSFYLDLAGDDAKLAHFLDGLDSYNSVPGPLIAESFDWSAHRKVLDVGGARGHHASHLVRSFPDLSVTVFDLPPLEPFFAELMSNAGLTERTDFHAGNFFVDDLPSTDVVIFGDVLHNWSPQTRTMLLRKAFNAIEETGAVLVFDRMIDDGRQDKDKLVASLNLFLATRGGGSEYTEAECQSYLRDNGFQDVTAQPFGQAGHVLMIGWKRA